MAKKSQQNQEEIKSPNHKLNQAVLENKILESDIQELKEQLQNQEEIKSLNQTLNQTVLENKILESGVQELKEKLQNWYKPSNFQELQRENKALSNKILGRMNCIKCSARGPYASVKQPALKNFNIGIIAFIVKNIYKIFVF